MDKQQALNRNLKTTAWGLLFILWGITLLFDYVPVSLGIIGSGLILLALNAVRLMKGIPSKESTTILGILALIWGGLELADQFLQIPFELSDWAIFAVLLIVLGISLLTRELLRMRTTRFEGLQ